MRKLVLTILILFAASLQVSAATTDFTFDTDNEGWAQWRLVSVSNYETLEESSADWSGSQGLPAGSIYQSIGDNIDDRAFNLKYVSTESLTVGSYLSASIRVDGDELKSLTGGPVKLGWYIGADTEGSEGWASVNSVRLDLNDIRDTGWVDFSVELIEENFFQWWPSGTSFDDVIADAHYISLSIYSDSDDNDDYEKGWTLRNNRWYLDHYGAYSDGNATLYVDNVVVPEPATIALLGLGAIVLIKKRK